MRRPWICLLCLALLALSACTAMAQPLKPCDLMKMLMSKDEAVAKKGADGFLKLGANAAVPLVCFIAGQAAGCTNPGETAKRRAEGLLVKLAGDAVPPILERLGTKNEEFRKRLVRILAQIKDDRRNEPLLALWKSEKSDKVRAALVAAIMSIDLAKGLSMLRTRVTSALPRELQAIAAQLAIHGTAADVSKIMSRIATKDRIAFVQAVIAQVNAIGGSAATKAIQRLKACL